MSASRSGCSCRLELFQNKPRPLGYSLADRLSSADYTVHWVASSADNERFLIGNQVHLLGAEAPMSILSACRAGKSTAGDDVRPRIDLTARTTRTIPAGTRFELGWRHAIDGVNAEMTPARALGSQAPVPHYLLPDALTRSEIPAGTLITGAMVEAPAISTLWRLRAEQDALFGL